MALATITPIAVKPVGANAAGCRTLFLIDKRYLQSPLPELNPTTGILTGQFTMEPNTLYPNPETLQLMAPIGETLGYTEEPLPEKGSLAKLYKVTWALAKNNPKLTLLENKYFIPARYTAIVIDQNGYAVVLGLSGTGGRIARTTTSGFNIGTDRNDLLFTYTVEETEGAPFYTTDSGDPADILNITYP